jgi:hypothetical protein
VPIKRLKYFTNQFLRQQDFDAEQKYHIEMRRRHNRHLHGWGVVEGLAVRKKGETQIVIEPGVAIDREGREIVLENPVTRDLSSFQRNSHTYITIAYGEEMADSDRYSSGGIEDYTRTTESPLIHEKKDEPATDGSVVTLARVRINENGHVQEVVEGNLRVMLRTRSSAAGWVRMAFKPVRYEPRRIGHEALSGEAWEAGSGFIVNLASAACEKSAHGSMAIPTPPGASKVLAFRICGTTGGKVEVELVRGGWSRQAGKGEAESLLKRSLNQASFDEHVEIAEDLQHLGDLDTLSVYVHVEGQADIWLVAVRFE